MIINTQINHLYPFIYSIKWLSKSAVSSYNSNLISMIYKPVSLGKNYTFYTTEVDSLKQMIDDMHGIQIIERFKYEDYSSSRYRQAEQCVMMLSVEGILV